MPTLTPVKPVVGRYMDIRTDYGFKAVFGTEPNKDILIEFLNDLLEGRKKIREIHYRSVEEIGETKSGKRVIYDLRCKGEDGEEFVVELQRARQPYFKDRMVFYFSRLISRLHRRGRKSNRYKLPEVYIISILDFRVDAHIKDSYYRTIALADLNSGDLFYDKLFLKWLELPNFDKTAGEIVTNIDKWMWLFKNLGTADKMPLFMDTRALKKVFNITGVANLKEEDRMSNEDSLMRRMDWEGAIDYARQEGRQELEKEVEELRFAIEEAESKVEEAESKVEQAESGKLDAIRFIKQTAALSNQEIAHKFQLPINIVEAL